MFVFAGWLKLAGDPKMVQLFSVIGAGQWFRYLTGSLEVFGAALLLIPATAGFGALLLAAVMVGAVLTHLLILGGSPAPALVLLVAVVVIAWGRRDRIRAALGR